MDNTSESTLTTYAFCQLDKVALRPRWCFLALLRRQSELQAILENSWVQRNFLLSNVDPPDSLYRNIPGNSFVLKRLDWSDWLRSVHLHPFTFCATAFSIHRSLFYDMGKKKSPAKPFDKGERRLVGKTPGL
jgi:hypothetical protein